MGDLFACACGPDGKVRMAALWKWWYQYLHDRYGRSLVKGNTRDALRHRMTRLTYEISGLYYANYTVHNDPGGWSGIEIQTSKTHGPARDVNLWVECDYVEDGLLLGFKALYEKYPPEPEDD